MEGHPGELHDVPPMQAFPLLVYLKAANAEVRYSYFLCYYILVLLQLLLLLLLLLPVVPHKAVAEVSRIGNV